MKKYITLFFLALVLFINHSCEKSNDIQDLDAEITEAMEDEQIRSLAACVVKGDEIVWEGTYGMANEFTSTPTGRNTIYTIMSIGKLFLSTNVMQLWERGQIDLDADINEYLPFDVRNPNFPDKKITAHMLLNHSSGLAWPEASDWISDFHHFYYLDEDPPLISEWLPEYILPEGSEYKTTVWKDFASGESFLYSNIGASLLALVVEEISGMDYRDFCKANILEPLEMNNSAFRLSSLNEESLVVPYGDNNEPIYYYTCRHYPAGFLSCDMEDFSHFVIAMSNSGVYKGERIMEEATFQKMIELQDPTSGTANLWVHCLGDCIGHRGGGTGFATWVEWHLESDRAFFIFSNKVNSSVYPTGRLYDLVKYQAYKY